MIMKWNEHQKRMYLILIRRNKYKYLSVTYFDEYY